MHILYVIIRFIAKPEITGGDDCLSCLPPLRRFGACRSSLGTLQLRLPRFLRSTTPVG
jgi:hypothetical protein